VQDKCSFRCLQLKPAQADCFLTHEKSGKMWGTDDGIERRPEALIYVVYCS